MRWRDDRGVGTMLGLALGLILLAAGAVVGSLVAIAVGHQRAAVSADLAALTAASHGCVDAERVARAQGAVTVDCRTDGIDAVVTVAMPAPDFLVRIARWSGREAPVLASSARAGLASG
jgi:secretion/DNA translocation related TadE-like protein